VFLEMRSSFWGVRYTPDPCANPRRAIAGLSHSYAAEQAECFESFEEIAAEPCSSEH
jgi:hypothetical protein